MQAMCFMPRTEKQLHDLFMSIIKNTAKNNTYKFALALFLIEYSCSPKSKPPYRVAYSEIAEHFLKYYWSHACKSKLRQGPKTQTPCVIKKIEAEFTDQVYPQTFKDLKKNDPEKVRRCVDEIRKRCLKDVIPWFQWINRNREVAFFWYLSKEYKDSANNARIYPDDGILVSSQAVEFLRKHCVMLYNSVILEWVRFLESKNFGTPNLVRKIEANHKGPRDQRKFLKDLQHTSSQCFYCQENLLFDRNTHVDHVLPYDYIGDTEMWNAVLACQECNCTKLDRLPPRRYAEKLSERNKKYYRIVPTLKTSIDGIPYVEYDRSRDNAHGTPDWLIDSSIAWHYKNASNSGYPVLRNFPDAVRTGRRPAKP